MVASSSCVKPAASRSSLSRAPKEPAAPGIMMPSSYRILLISGSTRAASTNTALLRTAHAVAPDGVTTELFERLTELPHFNPDHDRAPLPTAVAALRAEIARSQAVLFSTPEYAGALPGSFKNLLDWT